MSCVIDYLGLQAFLHAYMRKCVCARMAVTPRMFDSLGDSTQYHARDMRKDWMRRTMLTYGHRIRDESGAGDCLL